MLLVALDAGHGLHTPGKRCLKSIDPNETRENVLNRRIADKVQEKLAGYRCKIIRVDDRTGEVDVPLAQRVRTANEAGADVYLSIHHNAAIKGGSGGGIVVIVGRNASEQSKALQKSVYEHTTACTELRGNRAHPMPEVNLYVLRCTTMPAVLGEFGFMDSTTDTPIILTDKFAEQIAQGIVDALVGVYQLERKDNDPMTQEKFNEMMDNYLARRGELPTSEWAKKGMEEAKAEGITDGTRPQAFATRQEVALMVRAAVYAQ